MDPITQGALGSTCAQAIIHKRPSRIVWVTGAIAAMSPDLDVFIRASSAPLLSLQYHRHFTHALFFIPFGAILVTLFLCLFQFYRKHWRLTLSAAFIGIATHGLLDSCTSYGTVLYWPISLTRVSLDIISIIDPYFSFPLIIGTTMSIVFFKRRYALITILWAVLFLSFNSYQHHRAVELASTYYRKLGNITELRAIPEFTSSTKWRIIALIDDKIYTSKAYVPLWGIPQLKLYNQFRLYKQSDLPQAVIKSPSLARDFKIFQWFTDGWMVRAPAQKLILVDARYIVNQPPVALWGIGLDKQKKHVTKYRFINMESNK